MHEYSSVYIDICVIICNINCKSIVDFDNKYSCLVLYTYIHIFLIINCLHSLQNFAICEFLSSL